MSLLIRRQRFRIPMRLAALVMCFVVVLGAAPAGGFAGLCHVLCCSGELAEAQSGNSAVATLDACCTAGSLEIPGGAPPAPEAPACPVRCCENDVPPGVPSGSADARCCEDSSTLASHRCAAAIAALGDSSATRAMRQRIALPSPPVRLLCCTFLI